MAEPTFGMATAWDESTLIGFAYGRALNGGARWWEGIQTPVADDVVHEWDGRTFAIIGMASRAHTPAPGDRQAAS